MKRGIIGTGNMGRVLGIVLAEAGHQVFFGAREAGRAEQAAGLAGDVARCGDNQQAAEFGELIYYNPRDVDPRDVLSDVSALDGKIIIDSHNGSVPAGYAFEPVTVSRAEWLQARLPRARVVKAFNTITQEIFEHAHRGLEAHRVACFLASDDAAATATVAELATSLGFVPLDCGELRQSRLLESAADLLRMLLYKQRSPWASFSLAALAPVAPGRLGGRAPSRLSAALSGVRS